MQKNRELFFFFFFGGEGILFNIPSHVLKGNILKACFIKQLNPFLNDQLDSNVQILFRHKVAYRGKQLKTSFLIKEKILVAKEAKHVYNVTCNILFRNKSKI